MNRLDRALLKLAETGRPRGADALLRDIEGELGDDVVVGLHGRRTPETRTIPSRRRLQWAIAAVIATLLLLGGPIVLWTMSKEPLEVDVVTTIPQTVTTLTEDPTPSTIGIPTTSSTTAPTLPLALDITWERVEDPVFNDAWIGDIAIGGSGYVAVGGSIPDLDAAVWVSGDGFEWTKIESDAFGSDQDWLGSDGDQFMNSVAIGNDVIVAVGGDEIAADHRGIGAIWYSPDGMSWTRVPHTEDLFGSPDGEPVGYADTQIEAVIWWDEQFIAAGYYEQRAAAWTSVDGASWTRTVIPTQAEWTLNEILYVDLGVFEDHVVLVATDGSASRLAIGTPGDELMWSSWDASPEEGTPVAVAQISGRAVAFGLSAGWRGMAWDATESGPWNEILGPWTSADGSGFVVTTSRDGRTLVGWPMTETIWGSVDGGDTWSTVGEFDPGLMGVYHGSRSGRSPFVVADILDEGDRILVAGSVDEWSNDPDLWGLCYFDSGQGELGSCRSVASIWIGVPAG